MYYKLLDLVFNSRTFQLIWRDYIEWRRHDDI